MREQTPQPRPHGQVKQMVKPGEATINKTDRMWLNADDLRYAGINPGSEAWLDCCSFDGVFMLSRPLNWTRRKKLTWNKTRTAAAVYIGRQHKFFDSKRGQYVGRFPLTHAFRLGQPTLRIQVRPQKVVEGPLRGPPPPPVATAKVA